MRHARHVAVRVVGVVRREDSVGIAGKARRAKPVAGCFVIVAPCPRTIRAGLVDHPQDVAHRIVVVSLGVVAHGRGVGRQRLVHPGRVVLVNLRRRMLPDMFPPRGGYQPVDRVVLVVGRRLDSLAVEEDGLLRVIADVG